MRYVPVSLALGLMFVPVALAGAQAQANINDCEKIQAADAYNQCLAKFGPSGKSLNMEPEKPGDIKNNSEDAAASGGRPGIGRHGGRHRRSFGGRKRASFAVGHHRR